MKTRRPEGPENDHAYNPIITLDGKCVECMKPKDAHNITPAAGHTPTPWRISADPEAGDRLIINDAGLIIVKRPSHEDAAYIVRAVNAHEELVKIAKAYRNLLRAAASTDGEVATFHHIEDVLKKAEGK